MINLIEKCIEKFASNSRYKNDIRFYAIFYKYTQITSDPDEVYDSINSLSLFDKLAKFYISWSWVLVNLSKDEKALEILNLGIDKKAEPINLLIQAKSELEKKIKEKKLYQLTNEQSTNELHQTNVWASTERKNPLVEPSSTMPSFATRLSLSSKSLKSTPNENLFIKSSANRQGFEILEEDSDENKQDSSNEQSKKLSTDLQVQKAQQIEKVEQSTNLETKSTNQSIEPSQMIQKNQLEQIKDKQEQEDSKHKKVKKNLIQKLKPLDEYKEPKIVIFENLKPNQKFYADIKRMYVDNTEYSFEEIRMNKLLKKRRESKPNSDLIKEIELLKAKIRESEERDREKASLQNQVDMLKKQIEMIIQASSITTQNSKRCLDEVDYCGYNGIDVDKSKKLKLSENKQFNAKINKLSERQVVPAEKELTIVRDLWNGTFASQYSPAVNYDQTNKDQQHTNQRKEFSIFKDPTQTNLNNLTKTNEFSYYPQMSTTATQDCFTIALPRDPSEFNAKLASTPAMTKRRF